jgi:hypothetical protein
MKFVVTRSGGYPNENPSCPNAQKELVSKDNQLSEAYTVDISSLEELTALSEKLGHPIIVFTESGWGFDIPEIEIYDGYRE